MFDIDPADAVPIWRQIELGVGRLVTTGTLRPGVALPSVRELARRLRVNPATVSKAYQRLSDAGVLVVQRGEGTFVAPSPPSMPRARRRAELRDAAARYATTALTLGASREEAVTAVKRALAHTEARTAASGPA